MGVTGHMRHPREFFNTLLGARRFERGGVLVQYVEHSN